MVTITDYTVLRTGKGYRAVTMKNLNCPFCNGKLRVRDSRRRKVIMSDGKERIFLLRRLQCKACGSIHLEMLVLMTPYKHYARQVIICALFGGSLLDCPAEESTIYRWRKKKEEML